MAATTCTEHFLFSELDSDSGRCRGRLSTRAVIRSVHDYKLVALAFGLETFQDCNLVNQRIFT